MDQECREGKTPSYSLFFPQTAEHSLRNYRLIVFLVNVINIIKISIMTDML